MKLEVLTLPVSDRCRVTGLRDRLTAHRNGRRSGDQFAVYVFDRFVRCFLTADQITAVSDTAQIVAHRWAGPKPVLEAAAHSPHSSAMLSTMPLIAGVDGCRDGWVVVVISFPDNQTVSVARVSSLTEVTEPLDSGLLAAVGVDIPIGLPDLGPRTCDVEARKMIGPRRNSVFPAPIRPLLATTTWEEAIALSRRRSGKGLSRQAFGILPKVAEADRVITPERQQRLIEVHPEVSFTALAGHPMAFHKAKPGGRAQRLLALGHVFPDVDLHASVRVPGVRNDDVLDAYAGAWSAGRWLRGNYLRLGHGTDQRGLRMEIIA